MGQCKYTGGDTIADGKDATRMRIGVSEGAGGMTSRKQAKHAKEALLKAACSACCPVLSGEAKHAKEALLKAACSACCPVLSGEAKHAEEALLKAAPLQNAIFNSANFSSIATDAKGVIQIFNVGAERM